MAVAGVRAGGIVSPEVVAFLLSWSLEPQIVAGIVLAAGLYAVGWSRLRRRGHGHFRLSVWRAVSFGLGLLAVALALLSPLATFDELLLFIHMIQHLLLVIVAAPLIWLGAPLLPVLWALPLGWRKAIGRLFRSRSPIHAVFHFLTKPAVAAAIYVVILAVWHVPAFYDAAQGRTALHDLEHTAFFAAALLYWWPVVHPTGGRRRLGYGAGVLYIVPALLEGNLIGALITFSSEPLYQTYARAPRLFGLSVIQDQQIAGLLMWVIGGLLLLIPIFVLVYKLVGGEDVEDARAAEPPLVGRAR
jgi:putative membrane protein